jgi:hypothetical protein
LRLKASLIVKIEPLQAKEEGWPFNLRLRDVSLTTWKIKKA